MTANRTRPVPVRRPLVQEKIVEFQPETVKAPFLLRCGAAAIDYILIVGAPVLFLLLGRAFGNDGAALLNSELNNIGWLLAIVILVSNQIILPVVTGRTVGKFLTGLAVVANTGSNATLKAMFFRQTLGYLLVLASGGLAFLTSIFSSTGRALHDYLSGTVVIYGRKVQRGR